jgi:hypothetical protein
MRDNVARTERSEEVLMPTQYKRYGFLDQRPEAILGPFAAAFGFLAYLNFATLATARATVGGGWLASALLGGVCGIAVLAALMVRLRAGKFYLPFVLPFLLVVAGLIMNKEEVWAVPNPPGAVTTAFQNGSLAFSGVVCLAMVVVFVRIYAASRKTGAENREASRMPFTSLHISRSEDWKAAADHPIDQGAWEVFADDHPVLSRYDFDSDQAREDTITWTMHDRGVTRERAIELREQREARVQVDRVYQGKMAAARPDLLAKHPQGFRHFSGGADLPTFSLSRPDGTRLLLQWRKGQVTVLRVSLDVAGDAALIAPLARDLDAHVYAEDGTRYA